MDTRSINRSTQMPHTQSSKTAESQRAVPGAPLDQAAEARTGLARGHDWSVDVSSKAREMADAYKKALDVARETPDVREDRVAELKEKIANGTYKADSGKIADGMLREAMLDHLAATEGKT